MTDHVREQAMVAMAAAITGLSTLTTVSRGRVRPFEADELNGANLRTGNERVDPETFPRPRYQVRALQIDVVIHVAQADGYETTLNAIFKEVEPALAAPAVAAACGAKSISLRNIDAPLAVQGEMTTVQTAMNFEVNYITAENAPDVAL